MSETKSETQHVSPFHEEDISAIEAPLPFTTSFNLDEPTMIDLGLLNEQEKLTLLRELEKRQNFADNKKITWTKDHVNLLFTLQTQLNKNNIDDYVPLKDRRTR